ncbi:MULTISPECIES: hypothetical protein [Streptomyces]|uniref:hypothetical protein n=1 Tax=Streptomyces TaxID=1883 RepID=UPI001E3810D1|nr:MULTISPECIES: hypothetical protein [Streptomyces]UFQ19413.1 hypothetical protein J2N69_33090 [Streptomyces huasconensis]WCL89033.1 hypothetical protein PPN52_33040 [Streptomyces sp. JCM 35825]
MSLLRTAVALALLTAAVGCGKGDDTSSESDVSLAAAGAATLFPGSGDERGPDIDFPRVAVGESAAVDVKVRNTSDAPLTVKKVAAENAEVSKDDCTGRRVRSGDECDFQMLLPPKSEAKSVAGSVTVETDRGTTSSSVSAQVVEKNEHEGHAPADPPTPEVATDPPSVEPSDATGGPVDTPPGTTVGPKQGATPSATAGPEEFPAASGAW